MLGAECFCGPRRILFERRKAAVNFLAGGRITQGDGLVRLVVREKAGRMTAGRLRAAMRAGESSG